MTDMISLAPQAHSGVAAARPAAIPAVQSADPSVGSFSLVSGAQISGPSSLAAIVARFAADVETDSGVALDLVDAGARSGAPAISVEIDETGLASVALARGLRADGRDLRDADERYGLEIDSTGIRVWATTPEGIHRGLTTLRQLITSTTTAGVVELSGVRIVDGPRFAWRGLSVDVARTFHDVGTIKRVIDMCSLYKLNVLHLHLTDDHGWRFEVPAWPALAEVGGAGALGDRPGGHYTQADVAAIVAYASERFVTVVPEVDMPGHTQAVFAAYPELAPEPSPAAAQAEAFGLAIGTLDSDRGRTREFVRDVLAAVAAQFPTSAWIHVGGDEAFGMPDEAHAAFVEFAVSTVRDLGRHAVGWQEAARADVGPEELIQYWIEPTQLEGMFGANSDGAIEAPFPPEVMELVADNLAKSFGDVPAALAKGASILVSSNRTLYLDRPHADAAATVEQEATRSRVGLPFYPPATLREMVEWDPVAETPAIESDHRIGGIEAAVWCETVTNRDDLEFLLLPRLAGVGERGWSTHPTDWNEYVVRLAAASRAWNRRGWNWFRPASIEWPDAV
ncbi:family 20 glycosylhydrolase [Microbacterium sp. B2969]|uniref:beta-N-acetylhexosaminidase n=1 Tax=Microbacterium alkaliflavum TaxID=3248839 RepID=A0ABW7Q5S9_9MICO